MLKLIFKSYLNELENDRYGNDLNPSTSHEYGERYLFKNYQVNSFNKIKYICKVCGHIEDCTNLVIDTTFYKEQEVNRGEKNEYTIYEWS